MNLQSKLIGAFDAVILALTAIVMVGFSIELMDPLAGRTDTAHGPASTPLVAEHVIVEHVIVEARRG